MPASDPAFPKQTFTVLVLGGYGNFGTIICERLSRIPGISTVVSGRNPEKCRALADRIQAQALPLDMNQVDLADKIKSVSADLVISTAGPFQNQDYRVALAAIHAGAHYTDLADARNFVCGITALDEVARQHDVLVVSGASSVPALSAAIIDSALPKFSRLDDIHHGISSSEKTPGVATVAGVLEYCGRPISQWRNKRWMARYGWQDLISHDFPKPLGRRWMANCDIPDLELFPVRYPSIGSARFSAGTGLRITLFGTWVLSWLVRLGLIRHAPRLAPFLRACAKRMEPLGNALSGMFVQLGGIGPDGKPLRWNWHLVALANHGPNIPCMAAVALARKLAAGAISERGAQPCIGLISAEEYLAELEGFDIHVSEC